VTEKPTFGIEGAIQAPQVVYVNTTQIVLTRDRLRECLRNAMDCNGKRDRWMIPLGILVPIMATLVTTSFTKRFGIAASEWGATFIFAGLLDLGWLVYALMRRGRPRTIDSIIEDLTKDSNQVEIKVWPIGEGPTSHEVPANARHRSSRLAVIARSGHPSFQEKIRQASQFARIHFSSAPAVKPSGPQP
jgi:hypothetical protein